MNGSLMYLTASRRDIMFAVCAYARFQVTPKVSHLHAMKRIFRHLKGQPKLGLWYPRDSPFDLEAFLDSDYAGASLDMKSSTGGYQFLDGKMIIVNEASIRRNIQLQDAEVTACLPNNTIFKELARMSAKTTAWNEFSSTMASAIICLANNQKFNFSKYIFDSMRQKTKVPHTEPQTKESVPTPSNDPLPSEKAKTSEVKKIVDLKKRVKKLERKKKSRTSGLKRLWKGRMINNIDQDVEITLVGETQGRMNEEDMFGVDYLDCDEVIMDATAGKEV
nr:putative ribonuclease H-like domain-containing protein [Tanacetum cinerariifolium]